MIKTCILCASEFEAKRSDALYCSEKCRAKANYKIRKRKDSSTFSPDIYEDNSPINLTDQRDEKVQVCVKGSLSIEEIMQMITKYEQEIAHITTEKTAINAQNDQLYAQNSELQGQINEIEESKIKKLQLILVQSDISIYNRFLNGEYINAVKTGDSFAKGKLKTEIDLGFVSAISLRKNISDYRLKVESHIITLQASAKTLRNQIENSASVILKNNEAIKELEQNIRFYQNRIIRHEKLLSR